MQYSTLVNTDQKISKISLGTMMWGDQVNQSDAFEQMRFALEKGVNFWDTAQAYTVPLQRETFGNTERIIGEFLAANPSERKNIYLASKFCARGNRQMDWVYDGQHFANREHIHWACDQSLAKLQTDYLDLYQIHWPDRAVNIFGQRNFIPDKSRNGANIEETAEALAELVAAGKVRHIGISNETPFGFMKWIEVAKRKNLPLVSIQNPYNLLNRLFEVGNSEIALDSGIGLLAYSPLAMGVLSGKYQNGAMPKNSRRDLFPDYANRFWKPGTEAAVQKYTTIAADHGLSPVQMALAFVTSQDFVASAIVGATTLDQLGESIDAVDLTLSDNVKKDIQEIYELFPDPCP